MGFAKTHYSVETRGYSGEGAVARVALPAMSDLSGSLTSIELAPLIKFLCGLGKSGDLLVSRDHWVGELSLDHGRLTAAAVENDVGPAALEFVAIALHGGDFEFSEGPPTVTPNLGPDPLADLEPLVGGRPSESWLAGIPGPTAIPRVVVGRGEQADDVELRLGRAAIYVLLDVDGQQTVRELAKSHGLLRTLRALGRLNELGLIQFEGGPPTRRWPEPLHTPEPTSALPTSPGPPPRGRGLESRALPFFKSAVDSGLLRVLVATAVGVVGLRALVQNFRVEGTSMLPTFGAGQVLVVNRLAYYHVEGSPFAGVLPAHYQGSTDYVFGGPSRGDIAVFRSPEQPDTDYIKRIVGLPGDSVEVRDGQVVVNGQTLDEPYVEFPATYDFSDGDRPLTVPDGQYFVLGDNRPDSYDSHFGWLVPADNLIGRVWVRYWPPNALAFIASRNVTP